VQLAGVSPDDHVLAAAIVERLDNLDQFVLVHDDDVDRTPKHRSQAATDPNSSTASAGTSQTSTCSRIVVSNRSAALMRTSTAGHKMCSRSPT